MATAKQVPEHEKRERTAFEAFVATLSQSPWLVEILRMKSDGKVVMLNVDDLHATMDARFDATGEDKRAYHEGTEKFASLLTHTPEAVPPIFVEIAKEGFRDNTGQMREVGSYMLHEGRAREARRRRSQK